LKRHAPATARNSEAIAEVLARELPAQGRVLEIASGSGEHAVFFARRFPALEWQPSDLDLEALASVHAYVAEASLPNVRPAIQVDAGTQGWGDCCADAILCVNMVHISPWEATVGLFKGSAQILAQSASLILYGPYLEDGVTTAQSNIDFNRSLKSRDPRWGLRALQDMDTLAARSGFERTARHQMPANNLTLVYRRA